jgi:hypothetical protein
MFHNMEGVELIIANGGLEHDTEYKIVGTLDTVKSSHTFLQMIQPKVLEVTVVYLINFLLLQKLKCVY